MELGVLLENFNSKFDLVAEQTAQIPDIKEKVDGLTEGVMGLTEGVMGLTEDMEVVKTDVSDLKEDMAVVKTDLEFIKSALKKKVDYDEFAALERRVIVLESKLRTAS